MKLIFFVVFISIVLSVLVFMLLISVDEVILVGGCFWCMEFDFEKLDGVIDVVLGFIGGSVLNLIYNGNYKGYFEVVKIIYDGEMFFYNDIFDYFWVNIDFFDD